MKEFRECWLPNDWEQIICIAMLGTHLDPKIHCFETWAAQIMSHNISLQNTPSFLTDDQLQSQLDIMMDAELQTLAQSQSISEIKDLHNGRQKPWAVPDHQFAHRAISGTMDLGHVHTCMHSGLKPKHFIHIQCINLTPSATDRGGMTHLTQTQRMPEMPWILHWSLHRCLHNHPNRKWVQNSHIAGHT